jgi:hypothetical protein
LFRMHKKLTQSRVGPLMPEKDLEQPFHLQIWSPGVELAAMGSFTLAASGSVEAPVDDAVRLLMQVQPATL